MPLGLDYASRQLLLQTRVLPAPEDLSIHEARQQMLHGQHATLEQFSLRREAFSGAGCGGWLMGDAQTHAYLVGELADRSDCAIVFIDYPRSPKLHFPEIQKITFAAICEILSNSSRHQIDANRFAIAGDSAGGNMATCLSLRFRQEGLPGPKLQILLYPALDARGNSASYRTFSKGLNLTEKTMRWFWQHHGKEEGNVDDPLFSPSSAEDEALRSLPDTLIITCELDVLRDEGEHFARRLREVGVDVCSVRFGGVLHGFMVTEALAKNSSGDLAIQLVANYLRRRLPADPPSDLNGRAL
jgi:acetyl esterase